ncbi:TPA: exodeoxyribonuclease VII large subunit, partial [Candidatus Sumerlaeota bacterium]|nr:exodeoxyribonuclease VII large subunit [Candidatus Sumerlaeota bacterium]
AIAASPIPVISAVGHETDFTIADFVADLRAPTPSAAAEIVVAEIWGLRERVARLTVALGRTLAQLVQTRRLQLKRLSESWGLRQPLDLVRQAIQRLDDLSGRMQGVLENQIRDGQHRLERAQGKLGALNPTAVLSRGYSIVSLAKGGRVVTRDKQAREGTHLRIQLSEGELRAAVLKKGEDMFEGVEVQG